VTTDGNMASARRKSLQLGTVVSIEKKEKVIFKSGVTELHGVGWVIRITSLAASSTRLDGNGWKRGTGGTQLW